MGERAAITGLLDRGPAQVLLVIDQPVLARFVGLALQHGPFHTEVATTEEQALATLAQWRPHLAVVDMDIAQGQILDRLGYRVPSTERTPVIALTRRGDLKTKLMAFERGVDDILTVPFCPEELVARLLAVLRRTHGMSVALTPTITLGDLEIDLLNRHARVGTSELHLTSLEQSLLYLLAANAGQVLSRDEILTALWGADFVADSNVVDRHIRNLRIKLQNGWRKPRYIATVPGQGYRFLPTELESPATPAFP